MILYFITGIISSLLIYSYTKSKKFIFLLLSFLPIFCITAFRYGIGYDYLHIYTPIFKNIVNGGTSSWEPGIIFICKIISIFSKDPFYFFFFTSLITIIFIYKAIINNSKIPWISLILFIFTGLFMDSMNAVRQFIAISIFVYSFKYIIEKNFIKYLFNIIIATMMHSSAFILIPVYFLCNLKLNFKKQILLLVLITISLPLINSIFINLVLNTKYGVYFNTSYNDFNPTISELIIAILLFLNSALLYKKNNNNRNFLVFYNLTYIFLIIAILSFKIILAYRLIMYFKAITIFMIPTLINSLKIYTNRIILIFLWFSFFISITLIGGYKLNWYETEYKSIFHNNF